MRDALAERLLAKVMTWTAEDIAVQRPILQAMASYKYDEYQQFSPGMRFVESLALWLSQFGTPTERAVAYEFVMSKLIFCSAAEMSHLVSIAYFDHIRPLLLRNAALDAGLDVRHVAKVDNCIDFKLRQRQCLFLGLSDGARIDTFRRYNQESLTHEQVWQTYEISEKRVDSLLKELRAGVAGLLGSEPPAEMLKFRTIVLLDDFSASGYSYLRKENGEWKGKIATFHRSITTEGNQASRLVDIGKTEVVVVLYMATEKARQHLEQAARDLWEAQGAKWSLVVVYPLGPDSCLRPGGGNEFEALLDAYYDSSLQDEHTDKGGTDLRYGFAWCGLPLVLSHNTPNNSLYLLWARSEKVRPLFPRVSRHKSH